MSDAGRYVCRLFSRDRPNELIEARALGNATSIGRDNAADWVLADADGLISRIHCILTVEDGHLVLLDQSRNGTFLESGARAPRGRQMKLKSSERISLGNFSLQIEPALDETGADDVDFALDPAPRRRIQKDKSNSLPAPMTREASLLEAFCEGANLDASALSSEDSVELMKRIGAIYQQTVDGLSSLMAVRAKIKNDHHLDRTTIGATANNPFKWASNRTLAQELLLSGNSEFLSEAHAIQACVDDLSQHITGTVDVAKATLALMMQTLSPAGIEAEAKIRGTVLRGRSSVCWDIFISRYAELADSGEDVLIKHAFRSAMTD